MAIHMSRVLVLALMIYAIPLRSQEAGSALSFDGIDDFALVPHSSSLDFADGSQASFELWLQPTSGPAVWHAFGKRGSCGGNFSDLNYQLARDSASSLHFRTQNCLLGSVPIPTDIWSHVAVIIDDTTASLYLNGSFRAQTSCQMGGGNLADLKIGGSSICTELFLGEIDEFRIWTVARSPEEIIGSIDCDIDANSPNLAGYWKFDEDTADQTIVDSSTQGNDGTLGSNSSSGSDDPTRVSSTAPVNACAFLFADGFESGDTSYWSSSAP